MVILTHGSDVSLAPTAAPLIRSLGGPLQRIAARLAAAGFHTIQLDATLRGLRPRELSRRARRDLQAMLHRRGMSIAGFDFFIPRQHFLEPEHQDRAMTATTEAIELCASLGRLPLSLALPVDRMPDDVTSALVEAAEGHDVALAVHAEDRLDAWISWLASVDAPRLGAGFDPTATQGPPLETLAKLGSRLTVARLADQTRRQRVPVGEGDLDLQAYRVSLDLSTSRCGPVVLDLRDLSAPFDAAASAAKAWEDASFEA